MFPAFMNQMRRARTAFGALAVIVILVAAPSAQQQTAFNATPSTAPAPGEITGTPTDIHLLVGRSTVLNVGSAIARISLTVPDIADAMVTAPSQILIHGKQPGTISLFVWDKGGSIKTYEVNVRRDLSALKEQLVQLFPGEPITVLGSGKDVVLSGTVSGQYVIEKAANVAAGYVEKKDNVVNLLKQQEGVASNQVMLRVRFAEVSRSALQELGASFVANARNEKWFGRTTTQQFAQPEWDEEGRLVFSDFLNLFLFNAKEGIGALVRALNNKGLFQSLAEPNLIATNGKEASFLAGGEYPYPIVQPSASGAAVAITFKEFGVRLNFTPTVLGGDLIHLKVRPEVSALDFTNAIVLEGFRVPALSTRRTETEVELRDGQTFAIAGLMNNTLTSSMSKIPGIGDIPIIGHLFRSRAHQKNQTELVVMITPTIIRRGTTGVSEGLPSLVEPYLGRPDKSLPNPDPYVGSPRYPATAPRADATQPSSGAPATRPATNGAPANGAPANAAPPRATPTKTSIPKNETSAAAPQPQSAVPTNGTSPAPIVVTVPEPTAPAAAPKTPVGADAPRAKAPTKEELRAAEKAREREKEEEKKAEEAAEKKRVADGKRAQEQQRAAARKAAEDKKRADQLARERAEREAELTKKNQELARKKAEEDAKKQKAMQEAAARLREAQAAYEKASKGGSN